MGTIRVENNHTFQPTQQINQEQQVSYFQQIQQQRQPQLQQPQLQQPQLQQPQLQLQPQLQQQQLQLQPQLQQNLSIQQLGGAKSKQHRDGDIQIDKAFGSPNNMDKIESKLRKLEVENRILKLVVENKDLTNQLNKLIEEGKIDSSIKQLIKVVRKSVK